MFTWKFWIGFGLWEALGFLIAKLLVDNFSLPGGDFNTGPFIGVLVGCRCSGGQRLWASRRLSTTPNVEDLPIAAAIGAWRKDDICEWKQQRRAGS